MKFLIKKKQLIKLMKHMRIFLKASPNLPILENLLIKVRKNFLFFIGTDLEIEIITFMSLGKENNFSGSITVSAKKLFNIFRNLPEESTISIFLKNEKFLIRSGRIFYSISTIPSINFPRLIDWEKEESFFLSQSSLRKLIESTSFSMAYKDFRYYLNGMFLEISNESIHSVSTDGHRMAICTIFTNQILPPRSIIIPRKGIIEISRILDSMEKLIEIKIGKNHIQINGDSYSFTSKLIDGNFPNYRSIIPKNPDNILIVDCNKLRIAITRVAVLSLNERFRKIKISIGLKQIKIISINSNQEEAFEIIDANYSGKEIEIAFNANYLLDILNVLKCENVRFLIENEFSSVQIEDQKDNSIIYIVMPIRL